MSGLKLKYFVLKPRGDDRYAYASQQAMLRYAEVIREDDEELANQLESWAIRSAAGERYF